MSDWHGYIGISWPATWTTANVNDAETAIAAMGTQQHDNPSHMTHLLRDNGNRRIIAESLWTFEETTTDNIKSVVATATGKPESEVTAYRWGRGLSFKDSNRTFHGWLTHGHLGDFDIQGHGANIHMPEDPTVVHVTSLADSGTGTLRDAIENHTGEPTFIVFDIGGYIQFENSLAITNPFLYVLGETAPEPGITIRMADGFSGSLITLPQSGTQHDILLRHIRLRYGDAANNYCLVVLGGYNIVIDHCSLSWASNNLMTFGLNEQPFWDELVDITIQYCLFAEPFVAHPTGLNITGDLWQDIKRISVHHNVFVSVGHRTPRLTGGAIEAINNLTYNWSSRCGATTRSSTVDFVNNYCREGPLHGAGTITSIPNSNLFRHDYIDGNSNTPSIYSEGNHLDGHDLSVTEDNAGFWMHNPLEGNAIPLTESSKRATRLSQPPAPVQVEAATDLPTTLLPVVGATLPSRDSVDGRLISNVENSTGPSAIPVDMADVGGWPAVEDL